MIYSGAQAAPFAGGWVGSDHDGVQSDLEAADSLPPLRGGTAIRVGAQDRQRGSEGARERGSEGAREREKGKEGERREVEEQRERGVGPGGAGRDAGTLLTK
eukprot:2943340-Rhodomonas_salina.1